MCACYFNMNRFAILCMFIFWPLIRPDTFAPLFQPYFVKLDLPMRAHLQISLSIYTNIPFAFLVLVEMRLTWQPIMRLTFINSYFIDHCLLLAKCVVGSNPTSRFSFADCPYDYYVIVLSFRDYPYVGKLHYRHSVCNLCHCNSHSCNMDASVVISNAAY
jgi:hypothetical protein